MSETPELKLIVEALLLAADEPLSIDRIQQLFENVDVKEEQEQAEEKSALPEKGAIKEALAALNEDYAGRGVECVELASGYTLRVKQDFAPWVAKLWDMKPARYTRAFLETLALIAYKQPITRSEIEQVRGVAVSSHIIKSMLERDWIKVVGHRDVPGKPAVFATTKTFLDYFNLKSLDELPDLQDIVDLDKVGDQLEIQLQQAMAEEGIELNNTTESTSTENAEVDEVTENSAEASESDATQDQQGETLDIEATEVVESEVEVSELDEQIVAEETAEELQAEETGSSNVVKLTSVKETIES